MLFLTILVSEEKISKYLNHDQCNNAPQCYDTDLLHIEAKSCIISCIISSLVSLLFIFIVTVLGLRMSSLVSIITATRTENTVLRNPS